MTLLKRRRLTCPFYKFLLVALHRKKIDIHGVAATETESSSNSNSGTRYLLQFIVFSIRNSFSSKTHIPKFCFTLCNLSNTTIINK